MECGFNNLEQGFLLVFAAVGAGSLFWLALVVTTASLRTIEIVSSLRRIAEALDRRDA